MNTVSIVLEKTINVLGAQQEVIALLLKVVECSPTGIETSARDAILGLENKVVVDTIKALRELQRALPE